MWTRHAYHHLGWKRVIWMLVCCANLPASIRNSTGISQGRKIGQMVTNCKIFPAPAISHILNSFFSLKKLLLNHTSPILWIINVRFGMMPCWRSSIPLKSLWSLVFPSSVEMGYHKLYSLTSSLYQPILRSSEFIITVFTQALNIDTYF